MNLLNILSGVFLLLLTLPPPAPGQSSAGRLSFTPQLLCVDNNEACAIGDINNDGRPDVVAGRLWYPAPDFVPHPVRPIAQHPPDYARNNGEYLYDVDGDGWLDVVASGWGETRLQWFRNPGPEGLMKGLEWQGHVLADTRVERSETGFLRDLDGDGRPEYIMNSWNHDNPFTVWRFDQPVDGAPTMTATVIGRHNGHGVGFGDVNGDGRTDILFDEGWYEHPATDPWAGQWRLHRDWQLDDATCPVQLIDLNGDGRQDSSWPEKRAPISCGRIEKVFKFRYWFELQNLLSSFYTGERTISKSR